MEIVYTTKGNEVYIDDGKAKLLEGYRLVEVNGAIELARGIRNYSIMQVMFGYGDNILARRINASTYDYRKSNIKFTRMTSKYTGVTRIMYKHTPRYMGYFVLNGKKVATGYFLDEYSAAVSREYTIRKHKVKVLPTGISLSDKQLNEEYMRITKGNSRISEESLTKKIVALNNSKISKGYNKEYVYKHRNCLYPRILLGGRTINLGGYTTYEDAAIVRNCYIVENGIELKLIQLDIPIEKQLELRKNIRTVLEIKNSINDVSLIPKRDGYKYKGINTQVRLKSTSYLVQLRVNGKRIYVGESKDIDEAAMMYNIYVIENGLTDKIINDVGMSIDRQKEYLISKGYTVVDGRFKKVRNKK